MSRFCTILSLIALLLLNALNINAQSNLRPEIFKPGNGSMILSAMSDNARYAISKTDGDTDVDNPKQAGGTLVDLTENTVTQIAAPKGWAAVNDVADNGLVVGEEGGLPGFWNPTDARWTTFEIPTEWDGGTFMAVTPDARYAVGYLRDDTDALHVAPICYDLTSGTSVELTGLPEIDQSGSRIKENLFYGISPDGRYALAQASGSVWLPVSPVTYIYDIKEQTWHPIGYTYNPQTQKYAPRADGLHFIVNQWMSADGRWVTGAAYVVRNNGQTYGDEEFYAPYRYDVVNDTFELLDSFTDYFGNKITSDGVILGASPYGNPYPTAYVRSGKFFISLNQILSQVYGMNLRNVLGDNNTGCFEALSADGLTAVMRTYDNCYVIKMKEPFADAAARVDLLANYSVSIPSGTVMNSISEISLTFDRPITCKNLPSSVRLLDSAGNNVRNALSTIVSAGNTNQFVITFRTQKLTPGETYSVIIPDAYISLSEDSSFKSKEITLKYTGRSEGAVKPITINPANGASIARINASTDPVEITFDASISVSSSVSAYLYYEDETAPLAVLQSAASGTHAYFYPLTEVLLHEGSDYRLEIPAGAVTDISGGGASEPITLYYKGAYRRLLSDDDLYIFKSTGDSFANLMVWQTISNQPGAKAESLDFEYGMPWLPLRDSEESTDWAMASHSMFATPGTSDDWLVTPQLYIPDENIHLEFDAQSYLFSKQDRLRVYIFTSDRVINQLSTPIVEEMRANGQLIIDEILTPGASEEHLAGEWTHFEYNLAPFAGKSIYLAFVNNNTDQSIIFLDNIYVVRNLDFIVTNMTPISVVDAQDLIVKGSVTINSALSSFKGITLTLSDENGREVSSIVDEDVTLDYQDLFNFVFPDPLPLTVGEITGYTIGIKTEASEAGFRYSVKDLAFSPVQRVILEEYTGSECGNCPLGIRAIENLESLFPDNFLAVTLRTYESDFYGTGITGYSAYLQCERKGAPSGRVNRGPILDPMVSTPGGYKFAGKGTYDSQGVEQYTWADAVADALQNLPDASVEAEVIYDAPTGRIEIPVKVRYAVNSTLPARLFAVVVEDCLPNYQVNYFFNVSDPTLGEWGAGGLYAQRTVTSYQFNDVARYVVNDNRFNGDLISTNDFRAGEIYTHTLVSTIPDGRITNPANCRIVVMLIDGSTDNIINAVSTPLQSASVQQIGDDNENITIAAAMGYVSASSSGEISLKVYTTAGILVGESSGYGSATVNLRDIEGVLIVNATTTTASRTVKIINK